MFFNNWNKGALCGGVLFASLCLYSCDNPSGSASSQDSQQEDSLMISRIYEHALTKGKAYNNLEYLTQEIGPRIAGSPKVQEAVNWSKGLMEEIGFDSVYLQPLSLRYWDRGEPEVAYMVDGSNTPLSVLALGGSVATPAAGLEAEVIEVDLLDELEEYGDAVKGKIVFVNKPWDETLIESGQAYGKNSSQRFHGPVKAAEKGAIGYLFRSLSSSVDDYAHTGGTRYSEEVDSIPAMAISALSANRLSDALKENPNLKVFMKQNSAWKGEVETHNLIAEWTGQEHPERIITIGAHIDSWDVGEGAHDNGTGTMGILDAIATLKELGYTPKNTIRIIYYMNEENGVTGSIEYGERALEKGEDLIAAIESDAGGFAPRGFNIHSNASQLAFIQANWQPLFEPYLVHYFKKGSPGVDSGVWGKHFPDAIMFNFKPDPHRYFGLHHSKKDVFEAVDKRELQSGVASIASLLYLLDQDYDSLK